MSLLRYLSRNRKAKADQSSLGKDGTPTRTSSTYTSNVTTAPSHSLSGRDVVGQPDETDQSSLGKGGTPTTGSTYTSNVTTAPSHSLSGRDFLGQPDEIESSLTDTFGIADSEKSKVATSDYSKCLSGFTLVSYLYEFC